jgi:predicted N-acetyltransferase YhbS
MSEINIIIRFEVAADYMQVERITFAAFELFEAEGVPKRDIPNEHYLVHLMRDDPAFVPELDFVAVFNGEIIGNIMYSKCSILRPDKSITEALVFGPVSIKPEYQRKGIGTQLIKHSLDKAKQLGYGAVIITGHPAYYPRFGFVPARQFGLTLPDGKSPDAFMALELREDYLGKAGGGWKCCAAFDAVEDEEAFRAFHRKFINEA